jgi:hypothetical protein
MKRGYRYNSANAYFSYRTGQNPNTANFFVAGLGEAILNPLQKGVQYLGNRAGNQAAAAGQIINKQGRGLVQAGEDGMMALNKRGNQMYQKQAGQLQQRAGQVGDSASRAQQLAQQQEAFGQRWGNLNQGINQYNQGTRGVQRWGNVGQKLGSDTAKNIAGAGAIGVGALGAGMGANALMNQNKQPGMY